MGRDQYGASSQDWNASQGDYNQAAKQDKGKIAKGAHQEREASGKWAAQQSGYDNDEWAKQAYGSDSDSRWGKSYDSVAAKSYDDEQYARKIWADDDQWAEDYDRYQTRDAASHKKAASAVDKTGAKTTYTVTPVKVGYGHGHGGHSNGGYGNHGQQSYGNNGYGKW